MNILLIKLSAIGDVIHTLPALAALRQLYPDADIAWVVEEAAADLLVEHPHLNRVIVSRRKTWLRDIRRGRIVGPLREMIAFLRELRSRRYELVIDFHGLFKSALIVALSGGKRKLGYASLQEGSGLFYNEKIPEDLGKHAVDRYLDFVRYLAGGARESGKTAPATGAPAQKGRRGSNGANAAPSFASDAAPEFRIAVGEEQRRRVAALLDEYAGILTTKGNGEAKESTGIRHTTERGFIAVNPVAFWETKLWEDAKFAELCDRIRRELGLGVILTGGKAGPLEKIRAWMKTEAVNMGGKTSLRELACLYRRATLVVSTDSGPMHLAAAAGTPVVALFGPTDPARTGPYGPGHRVIQREISCRPCFRKRCEDPRCMKEISVEEVFEAVREMLAG